MDEYKHKQVKIKIPPYNYYGYVDEGIVDLVQSLWRQKIMTGMSCQEIDGNIWLMFDSKKDFVKFLGKVDFVDITLSDIRLRRRDKRIAYEYVSVRFPIDLKNKIKKRIDD